MDAEKTLREHGLRIGELEPGPTASIADVAGVAVGHATVGCTGVTAVLPGPIERLWAEPVPAGVAVLNGAGELTGSLQIAEWGVIETPVYLTATMSVGRVYDGAVAAAMAAEPSIGVDAVGDTGGRRVRRQLAERPARAAQVEAERRAPGACRRGRVGARSPKARWAPAPEWSASAGRAASEARAA